MWGNFKALTGFGTLSMLNIGVSKVDELFAVCDALKEPDQRIAGYAAESGGCAGGWGGG